MNYQLTEKNGVITAVLPIALKDGRTLMIRGSASIADTYRELGLDPRIGEIQMVGWNPFKAIGKVVKKITKSKALKKVLKVGKSILKSPITTAALGAVTGGAAIAPMAAVNVAMNLADAAIKPGKKGQTARKVLKTAVKAASTEDAKKRKVAIVKQAMGKKGIMTPQALSDMTLRSMTNKIQARKRALPAMTTPQRAADWLINVHLV